MNTQQAVQRMAKIPPKKLTLAAAKKWIAMLEDELRDAEAVKERASKLEVQLENEKAHSAHLRNTAEERVAELNREVEHLTEKLGEGVKVLEGLLQAIDSASRPKPFATRLRYLFKP